MPIVSKTQRSDYLKQHHPILYKLCVAAGLPSLLEFRINTDLPFCYGRSDRGSPIPAEWDDESVSVIPLWETPSGVIAIRTLREREEFVYITYEDAGDVKIIAKSTDGLFAYLFYFLVESCDGSESDEFSAIARLASYLEFDKLDAVIEAMVKFAEDPDYESLWQFTRSFEKAS